MTAQETVNKIVSHLLGKDWYSYYTNHEDINDEIVETICRRYPGKDEGPVAKWRRKHKKCGFCQHVEYLNNPCGISAFKCKAKDKLVNTDISRPLCGLFELREDKDDG